MSRKIRARIFAAVVVSSLGLAASVLPVLAAAHGKQGNEHAKKPGENCESYNHASAQYKACVEKQAQSEKKSKGQKHAHGKPKVKGKQD